MSAIITKPTAKDVRFVALHESPGGRAVTRAYRCPANVITIGHGYTMGSRVFAAWARAKWGRPLQMGDTMTQAEADALLGKIMEEEYGRAVSNRIKPILQHVWGGATSMAFNCGVGSLNWKWAADLASRLYAAGAGKMRTTATTANGRRLPGLVRRRAEEARLVEFGDYGKAGTGSATTTPAAAKNATTSNRDRVRQYQDWLNKLGYKAGAVDGIHGKATNAAVRRFQADHGLVIDGIVGPATLSTLIRQMDLRAEKTVGGGAGAAGGAGTVGDIAASGDVNWLIPLVAIGAVVVIIVAFQVFRHRGKITGKRVPVA